MFRPHISFVRHEYLFSFFLLPSLIRGSRSTEQKRKVETQTFSHFKVRESLGAADLFFLYLYLVVSSFASLLRLLHVQTSASVSQASFQQPIRPTSRCTGELQVFSEFQPCDPYSKRFSPRVRWLGTVPLDFIRPLGLARWNDIRKQFSN